MPFAPEALCNLGLQVLLSNPPPLSILPNPTLPILQETQERQAAPVIPVPGPGTRCRDPHQAVVGGWVVCEGVGGNVVLVGSIHQSW